MIRRYPEDSPQGYDEDNGTMPDNINTLAEAVVGHRIVKAEQTEITTRPYGYDTTVEAFVLTLDNGQQVIMQDDSDCCAYTKLNAFIAAPDMVEHVITGVESTDGYTRWHIYAAMGDVLELQVGWSCGNAFYYGYGFAISVQDMPVPKDKQITEMRGPRYDRMWLDEMADMFPEGE